LPELQPTANSLRAGSCRAATRAQIAHGKRAELTPVLSSAVVILAAQVATAGTAEEKQHWKRTSLTSILQVKRVCIANMHTCCNRSAASKAAASSQQPKVPSCRAATRVHIVHNKRKNSPQDPQPEPQSSAVVGRVWLGGVARQEHGFNDIRITFRIVSWFILAAISFFDALGIIRDLLAIM